MSRNRTGPLWYVEGDVGKSIRNARDAGLDRDRIVSTLAQHDLEDLPEQRIEAIVKATPDDAADADLPLSQSPSTDATPRDPVARALSVDDLAFLSRRELARVVGLVLEQFEGNTVRPGANRDVAVDCYWHRQRMTVGLRTVPATDGIVGTDHVEAIADGEVRVEGTRAPSELVVVTNGTFTEDATDLADDRGVRLFDGGHVETWLRRAALPPDVVGTVLEDGENHDGPLDDLVELPPIPEPRRRTDPFAVEPTVDATVLEYDEDDIAEATPDDTGTDPGDAGRSRSDPLVTEPAPAGETGTLYADPDADGDYDAFDNYLEEL